MPMDIRKNDALPWFPRELQLPPGQGAPGSTENALQGDTVTLQQDRSLEKGLTWKGMPAESREIPPGTGAAAGEKVSPFGGVLGKWLKNSMVGLFIGLTLLGTAGCGTRTAEPPLQDKPPQEKVISQESQGISSMEDFQRIGESSLVRLSEVAQRYGGNIYAKTDKGPSTEPLSAKDAYNILLKGQSFYFRGSSATDYIEVKNVKEFGTLYKEVIAEAAKQEATGVLDSMTESLKSSEYGQKVMAHLGELAKSHGGDIYRKSGDSLTPLTPLDAYKDVLMGKTVYFKGGKDAEPLEIKNLQGLGTVYQQVIKESAIEAVKDQGMAWVQDALQNSTQGQQVLSHLQEITGKFGGNIYGKTDKGPSEKPLSPMEAYQSLSKGEGIYLKGSKNAKPVEIRNLQQLGTIYKEITGEIAKSGMQESVQWAKDALKDSQATKDLLIHLADLNTRYGGSMYTAGQDGAKTPLSPLGAYDMLSKGGKFYFQPSKEGKAREIKSADDLVKAYMEVLQHVPKEEGSKEAGKTGDLLKKLLEEQLGKYMPGAQAPQQTPQPGK
ncbi:MAG: hypothetical protein RDV48_20930 [Candidatus Eremiobacteraeota bacterium]|nr:hypothetical protein [Candidatus Eremiobacteraeota bacterium]